MDLEIKQAKTAFHDISSPILVVLIYESIIMDCYAVSWLANAADGSIFLTFFTRSVLSLMRHVFTDD